MALVNRPLPAKSSTTTATVSERLGPTLNHGARRRHSSSIAAWAEPGAAAGWRAAAGCRAADRRWLERLGAGGAHAAAGWGAAAGSRWTCRLSVQPPQAETSVGHAHLWLSMACFAFNSAMYVSHSPSGVAQLRWATSVDSRIWFNWSRYDSLSPSGARLTRRRSLLDICVSTGAAAGWQKGPANSQIDSEPKKIGQQWHAHIAKHVTRVKYCRHPTYVFLFSPPIPCPNIQSKRAPPLTSWSCLFGEHPCPIPLDFDTGVSEGEAPQGIYFMVALCPIPLAAARRCWRRWLMPGAVGCRL